MDSFGSNPLWDLSQPIQYSQIPDEDFLALLTKQFPPQPQTFAFPTGDPPDGVNPQALSRAQAPSSDATPPLTDDNSPSPPSLRSESRSRRVSTIGDNAGEGSMLKRKASAQDFDDDAESPSSSKKSANRRKSTGGGSDKDEGRLLRRKEQNRAAQRAFRERKEKHVKDLEDRVAELEAIQIAKESENENLRDLLQRLQTENQSLKQTQFTFSMPHGGAAAGPGPTTQSNMASAASGQGASMNLFSQTPLGAPAPAPTSSPMNDDIDWNALTAFDPSVLSMLDEPADANGAMNVDFDTVGDNGHTPYKTLVSNPMFMSFADPNPMYDQFWPGHIPSSSTSPGSPRESRNNNGGSGSAAWTPGSSSWSPPAAHDLGSLDDIFGTGNFMLGAPGEAGSVASPPNSISPVSHQAEGSSTDKCPKTKEEMVKHMAANGNSVFAEGVPAAPTIQKKAASGGSGETSQIFCAGSNFPKIAQSTENIEVLQAWRQITNNPSFKDLDINELCSEFTSKAKCDGTKVVLEPAGVKTIIEKLSAKVKP